VFVLAFMAGKKRKRVESDDLCGFKYFKVLADMLETLHDAACARDRAHNRTLHMDQYMTLLLMFMFNPICSSLRALQEASELKKLSGDVLLSRDVLPFSPGARRGADAIGPLGDARPTGDDASVASPLYLQTPETPTHDRLPHGSSKSSLPP